MVLCCILWKKHPHDPSFHMGKKARCVVGRRPDPRLPSARDCKILSEAWTEWHKNAAAGSIKHSVWSNYSDLTRPHLKWWFSKGNPLISGKSPSILGGGNSNIFYFHPEPWGSEQIWRAYFSDGWFNHQPVVCVWVMMGCFSLLHPQSLK